MAIAVSFAGMFVFLASAYYVLTNADLSWREVLPGAFAAAVILEATFQLLPLFVRVSTNQNPVIQTLSGPAVLLVWLYVMANVIVLGAEVNWWHGAPRRGSRPPGPARSRGKGPERRQIAVPDTSAPAMTLSARPTAASERRRGAGAVRVLALPVVAELGDGLLVAGRDEDRVVAEAALAPPLERDRALEHARPRSSAPSGAIATSPRPSARAGSARRAAARAARRPGRPAAPSAPTGGPARRRAPRTRCRSPRRAPTRPAPPATGRTAP